MPTPRGMMAALMVCATLAAGTVAGGCGGDDSDAAAGNETASTQAEAGTSAASAGGGPAVSSDEVEIVDFKFAPDAVTVDAGTEVAWANADEAPHTATADDGSFDTGNLAKGDSASATLDEAGTYSYYCRFHPFMKATIEVR